MATGVRIQPPGALRDYQRRLKTLGATATDFKEANARTSSRVVQQAKALTPVRAGKLQNTVRANKAQNKAVIMAGTKRVSYASFVEFGSEHNTAVEMVTRAITMNQEYILRAYTSELESLIARLNLN